MIFLTDERLNHRVEVEMESWSRMCNHHADLLFFKVENEKQAARSQAVEIQE